MEKKLVKEDIEDLLDNAVRRGEIDLTWAQIQDIAVILSSPLT